MKHQPTPDQAKRLRTAMRRRFGTGTSYRYRFITRGARWRVENSQGYWLEAFFDTRERLVVTNSHTYGS